MASIACSKAKLRAGAVSRIQPARLSARIWCQWPDLHVGPGDMSRAAGTAAAVPAALLEGEDDALVDGAAFQLAVGLGGLLHGHGLVRA